MSKLNERLTLIANISVVLGILFLAFELQQNTQAIQAQTRDSITEKQMEYLGWIATSPELASVLASADLVEAENRRFLDDLPGLGRSEAWQWRAWAAGQVREWENSFYQCERGLFTESEYVARRAMWRRRMMESGWFRTFWEGARETFAPSFRAEIDRIVAEVGG